MNKRQDLFSKLKDYNNELEKLLTKKEFSNDVKNLLLEMVYQLETSYEDYKIVKRDVTPKVEIISNITDTIINKCDEIELLNPREDIKYIIDEKKSKLSVFPNEKYLLYSLIEINNEQPDYIDDISKGIISFFEEGSKLNNVEIIRDFDGWSWNVDIEKTNDILCNLIYQNLQIILDHAYVKNWTKRCNIEELKMCFAEKYNKEIAIEFVNLLLRYSMYFLANMSSAEKLRLQNELKKIEKELEQRENKKEYLKNVTEYKKQSIKRISEIDKILTNKLLMNAEYEIRNKELQLENKIFSVKYLTKILEQERNQQLMNIKEHNELLDPKKYVQKTEELRQKIEIYKYINSIDEEIYILIDRMQEIFIECLNEKIIVLETKKDIINYIYILRYYNFLKYNKNKKIGDVKNLQIKLDKVQKELITKACNEKILNIFSQDIKYNYEILKQIIHTNIINLENIDLLVKQDSETNSLIVELYETDIVESKSIIKDIKEDIRELKLRLNKRQKVFI